MLIGGGAALALTFVRCVIASGERNLSACPTCGVHSRAGHVAAARAAGAVSGFASGSYAGARAARDLHAVTSGRVGTRIGNKIIGRTLVSRMWLR